MNEQPTSGWVEVDRLVGGICTGDNIVLEADSGVPTEAFVMSFVRAGAAERTPLVYVSFNRSPQSVAAALDGVFQPDRLVLVDCFSHGKGHGDPMFLKFYEDAASRGLRGASFLRDPGDPRAAQEALMRIGSAEGAGARYVFDSLTGMLNLWGDEESVVRFFGHVCPRLYDLDTLAYWLLEREAHTTAFLAKLRHITQVVLSAGVSGDGGHVLTVRKAVDRDCTEIGVPHRFRVEAGRLAIDQPSRDGVEMGLLGRMGDLLGSALELPEFLDRLLRALATDLGMIRATLVLLDRGTDRLRIAAAHGLTTEELARGEYAVGEGVTGLVVKTGHPEVVPDVGRDPRFLDRTQARRGDPEGGPLAFICVPVRVDHEVVGALSVDRPYAVEATLMRDLRLLTLVSTIVAQVIKINRLAAGERRPGGSRSSEAADRIRGAPQLSNVVGRSGAVRQALQAVEAASASEAAVLIGGETGTGKELVARLIHHHGRRAGGPFVKVYCGGSAEGLLESELFGHVKGAFAGAVRDRRGRIEAADGGTLFLEDVDELPPRLQAKLLGLLQGGRFEPAGSDRPAAADVRVLAATTRDLKAEVRAGRFREDLYYKLSVIPVALAPLRERREDIPLLVDHFLEHYNRLNGKRVQRLFPDVMDLLTEYPWPGNVRELQNCIERAVVMSGGETLSMGLLPAAILDYRKKTVFARGTRPSGIKEVRLAAEQVCLSLGNLGEARRLLLDAIEEAVLRKAADSGLSQRELSRRLDLSRATLRKKMREHRIK